jgi:hypothetical protein
LGDNLARVHDVRHRRRRRILCETFHGVGVR